MTEENPSSPLDAYERKIGAAAHASVIIPFLGAVVPILIWASHRNRSNRLAFQSLQAALFQSSIIAAWFLIGIFYTLVLFLTILATPLIIQTSAESDILIWIAVATPVIFTTIILAVGIGYLFYGMIGAILIFTGKPFRYVIAGKFADRLGNFTQRHSDP